MKLNVMVTALVTTAVCCGRVAAAESSSLIKDQDDRISYSIGVQIGNSVRPQIQQQDLKIKPDVLAAGLKDALAGGKTALTEQEIRETLTALQKDAMGKQAEL